MFRLSPPEAAVEKLLAKFQKLIVSVLIGMLALIVLLSTVHLGVLIGEEIWKQPRFLISVESLLDVFGYFLLVLIGVELLETIKSYMKEGDIHVRVVLEVALIAMARKAIVEEPHTAPGLSLFGLAALILGLAAALYVERQSERNRAK